MSLGSSYLGGGTYHDKMYFDGAKAKCYLITCFRSAPLNQFYYDNYSDYKEGYRQAYRNTFDFDILDSYWTGFLLAADFQTDTMNKIFSDLAFIDTSPKGISKMSGIELLSLARLIAKCYGLEDGIKKRNEFQKIKEFVIYSAQVSALYDLGLRDSDSVKDFYPPYGLLADKERYLSTDGYTGWVSNGKKAVSLCYRCTSRLFILPTPSGIGDCFSGYYCADYSFEDLFYSVYFDVISKKQGKEDTTLKNDSFIESVIEWFNNNQKKLLTILGVGIASILGVGLLNSLSED